MCDGQHDKRISADVEPQPVGHLKESPAINNEVDGSSIVDLSQFGDEHNFVNLSIEKIKIEVKEENKKPSKSNDDDANEATIGNRQRKHPSGCCSSRKEFNRSDRAAKKPTKANTRMKQHQCTQCEYKTKNKSDLDKHLLKHTGETPFKCSHCERAFKSKQTLNNHIKVHVKEFLFNCAVCLKGLNQKNDKMEHESNCKMIRYECHLCKNSFGSFKGHLINHMRIHSGEKPFECNECSEQFQNKRTLNFHIKSHAGPLPFRCSICWQRFSQKDEMVAHQQKCNRRVYECYVCGKSFGLGKNNLEKHMRTHTGDKPFECTQCPKKFTQKDDLNVHMKIHSRSLPWKCAICRQGFQKQMQWKAHQHNCSRRVYECFDCKMFFGLHRAQLMGHMTKHSGEKAFRCEICGNRFTQKSNLTKHIKSIHKE